MKLDVRAAALGAGCISALVYAVCAVVCVLVPESAVVYVTTGFFHIDITGLIRQFTLETFVVGLLGWGLGMAVGAGAMAWLYNRLARTETERPHRARREDFTSTGRTA